jgi:uncharacterized protein YodC (DUF2158 family)
MSVNQDTPPETRKLVLGDQVQLKGGQGPKMTVVSAMVQHEIICSYWKNDNSGFDAVTVPADALAYFGDGLPPSVSRTAPITQSHATIEAAIRNGRRMLSSYSQSYGFMLECFNVIATELIQHVDIEGGSC